MNKFFKTVLLTGLFVGTTDIVSALSEYYLNNIFTNYTNFKSHINPDKTNPAYFNILSKTIYLTYHPIISLSTPILCKNQLIPLSTLHLPPNKIWFDVTILKKIKFSIDKFNFTCTFTA